MYKMQLTPDYCCELNLLSIQQGVKESKSSREKYFKQILKDTIKALKKNENSYLFNREQIIAIKRMAKQEHIVCLITEIEKGIWLVVRK